VLTTDRSHQFLDRIHVLLGGSLLQAGDCIFQIVGQGHGRPD
jgi:hypothetical protein